MSDEIQEHRPNNLTIRITVDDPRSPLGTKAQFHIQDCVRMIESNSEPSNGPARHLLHLLAKLSAELQVMQEDENSKQPSIRMLEYGPAVDHIRALMIALHMGCAGAGAPMPGVPRGGFPERKLPAMPFTRETPGVGGEGK